MWCPQGTEVPGGAHGWVPFSDVAYAARTAVRVDDRARGARPEAPSARPIGVPATVHDRSAGHRPSRRRRAVVGAVAVAVAVVAVAGLLAIEVVVAGGGTKLTEYDPHLADGVVGADGAAGAAPLRVVWLGDSTAAGVGASSAEQAVSRQVARRLGRPVELEVLAVSGARVADVLDQQLPALVGRPDLVLVSVGANDVTHLTASATFREQYGELLDRVPAGVPVVAIGVPDMGSPTRLAQPLRTLSVLRGERLDDIVRDLAARRGAAYVNLARTTGAAFRSDPDTMLAGDRYHPSDAGYAVWADAITPVARWALERAAHPGQPAPPVPAEST